MLSPTQLSDFLSSTYNGSAECRAWLNGTRSTPSQSAQDIFIWRNFFSRLTADGMRGRAARRVTRFLCGSLQQL